VWWRSKKELFTDDTISWDDVEKVFVEDMKGVTKEDKLKFWDVCSKQQGANESPSDFIRMLSYQAKNGMAGMKEKHLVDMIIHNMNNEVRRYIITRGKPGTYQDLERMVREYENSDMMEVKIKTENPVLMATLQKQEEAAMEMSEKIKSLTSGIEAMLKEQEKVMKEVLMVRDDRRGGGRDGRRGGERNRHRSARNIPKCWECGRMGHVAAVCRAGRGSYRGGRGGFRGGFQGRGGYSFGYANQGGQESYNQNYQGGYQRGPSGQQSLPLPPPQNQQSDDRQLVPVQGNGRWRDQ